MRKSLDDLPVEKAAAALAYEIEQLAHEAANNGDIYGVHYLVTQLNAIRRMSVTINRRMGRI